jgi:TatD DNase family protein
VAEPLVWRYNVLIDAHAHADRYGDALPAALQEIERQRIFTISNSMDLESYQRNLEIAAQCSWVLPIFGVHPWNAVEHVTRLVRDDGCLPEA